MKKPPAILLNDDFYSKGRNIRWIKENGAEAVLILQCVWIASSKEKDCKIARVEVVYIPFLSSFSSEKIYQVLDSAVVAKLLNGDENYYWNSQVVENTENFQARQKRYSAAAKAREEQKRKQDSATILPQSSQDSLNINNKSTDKYKSKAAVFEMEWSEQEQKMIRSRRA